MASAPDAMEDPHLPCQGQLLDHKLPPNDVATHLGSIPAQISIHDL